MSGRNRCSLLLIAFLLASFLIVNSADALSKESKLAEELYLKGDYRSAAHECERLLRKYRVGKLKNEIAYLAGLCYLKLNDISKSKGYFEFVLHNSNDSMLVNEAQIGLANISKDALSIGEPPFFSVQIGSFKQRRNAYGLYNRFRRKRYTVRIIEERDGSSIIYKVKIGKFKSRQDATNFAKGLRKGGYQTAIVAY